MITKDIVVGVLTDGFFSFLVNDNLKTAFEVFCLQVVHKLIIQCACVLFSSTHPTDKITQQMEKSDCLRVGILLIFSKRRILQNTKTSVCSKLNSSFTDFLYSTNTTVCWMTLRGYNLVCPLNIIFILIEILYWRVHTENLFTQDWNVHLPCLCEWPAFREHVFCQREKIFLSRT